MFSFTLILAITAGYAIPKAVAETNKCRFIYYQTPLKPSINCTTIDVCQKTFQIIQVEMPPYDDPNILEGMIDNCCGECHSVQNYQLEVKDFNPQEHFQMVDFSYPFLGDYKTKTLYGYHFIPLVQAPNFFYITPKSESPLKQLIISSINLWPLLVVCLLTAALSGFFAWILETWSNGAEFPRPFLTGWFEGFWWSFISMTTVGYGDKTPKSLIARIFSVAWIVMGVALFGIVTSEMTNAIMTANQPPEPDVYGSKVGVLRYREYDAHFVAQHGGVIKQAGNDVDDDFKKDVLWLSQQLRSKEIDGMLLDKHTLAYVLDYFQNKSDAFEGETREVVNFFLDHTVRTAKVYHGDKLAYGIIVRDKRDHDYFRDALIDNRLPLATTKFLKWNKRELVSNERQKLFDPDSKIFQHGILTMVGCIGGVLLFGLGYEIISKKFPTRVKHADQHTEDNSGPV